MRTAFDKRTRALESRAHVGQVDEETAKLRIYLSKLSDEELERGLAIAERTNDYTLPLTPEEQNFLTEMEAKYEYNST